MRLLPTIPLLLALTTLHAQTTPPDPQPDQAPFTFRTQSNLVLVPVQVQTKKGAMIYALQPNQFLVRDNGVPQSIKIDEDTDALGLNLAVVVQCSRTAFNQFDRMHGLQSMIDDLVGPAPHQIALINYGTEVEVLTNFTSSAKKLEDAFTNLQTCEDETDARTLDAVDQAVKLFDTLPAHNRNRRAILLIGETRDHGSQTSIPLVTADLTRSNIVVDAISFNPGKEEVMTLLRSLAAFSGPAPSPKDAMLLVVNALRRNIPSTLTTLTGGEYTNFNSTKGFEAGVHSLTNHIHNFYLISFQPTFPTGEPPTPGLHGLSVKVPDYPEAKIRYRLTYFYGNSPPQQN